jgi:endonuclease/exonuclease/phosphatase family metal-dependent hydrolase
MQRRLFSRADPNIIFNAFGWVVYAFVGAVARLLQPMVMSRFHSPCTMVPVLPPTITIATWNVSWQSSTSPRGQAIRRILEERCADIVVLTEVSDSLLDGDTIQSQPDYGYKIIGTRRKVSVWSRNPWWDTDEAGDPNLPSGRFVAGTTDTPLGRLRVIGVCIPWRDAHVRTGRKNRGPWEDHLNYLDALRKVLADLNGPAIVAGDFNQTIPRSRAPVTVADALRRTFKTLSVATIGPLPPLNRLAIDHVVHTPNLILSDVACWSEYAAEGAKLSDHFGVQVKFRADRWPQYLNTECP